jgi:hypothetical protein
MVMIKIQKIEKLRESFYYANDIHSTNYEPARILTRSSLRS